MNRRAPLCRCGCTRPIHKDGRGCCLFHFLSCRRYVPAPPLRVRRLGNAAWKALGQ